MGALAVPPSVMVTRSEVCVTPGMGLSRMELIQLKIVELAPMPSASVTMAMAAKPGDFFSIRRLYRKSASKAPISRSSPHALLHCNRNQSCIIVPVAAAKRCDGIKNLLLQLFRACVAIFPEPLHQTGISKFFALRKAGFRHAVSEAPHAVPRLT